MTRIIPDESHGSDIRTHKISCYQHYSGVKTGFQNSCCCCSPCGYDKYEDVAQGVGTHCWRCHPQILSSKFTPNDTGNACCVSQIDYSLPTVLPGDPTTTVDYTMIIGSGNNWTWSLTNTSGTAPVTNTGCYWRLECANQSIDNYYEIDHFNITSLEPPNVSISGIVGPLGCTGVVTFGSYDRKPIPFQSRTGVFGTEDIQVNATGSMTNATFVIESGGSLVEVTQDIGDFPQSCSGVPRYLCIRKNRGSSEPSTITEFNWDSGFAPYHLPYERGIVYGKWVFNPPNTGYLDESLYLVETYSGQYTTPQPYSYAFRSNFAPSLTEFGNGFPQYKSGTPASLIWDSQDELWSTGIPISGQCSCQLNIDFTDDMLGESISIRGGKCSPWKYYCGSTRCAPKTLCGIISRSGVAYRNMSWDWNDSCKCWQQISSGVDVTGSGYDENVTIYLNPEGSGQYQSDCIISTSNAAAYSVGTQRVSKLDKIPTISLGGSGWSLVAYPDFGEGCGWQNGACNVATPCIYECGSNPAQLNLFISGYGFEDPPYGTPQICTADVELTLYEEITIESNAIVRNCEYRGSIWEECDYGSGTGLYEIEFILGGGQLEMYNGGIISETILLDESCDPYYATGIATFGSKPCDFGCGTADPITQYTVEITEL